MAVAIRLQRRSSGERSRSGKGSSVRRAQKGGNSETSGLHFVFSSSQKLESQTVSPEEQDQAEHWVGVPRGEVSESFVISSCKVPGKGSVTSMGNPLLQGLQAFGTRGLFPPKELDCGYYCELVLSLVGRRIWNLLRHSWHSEGSPAWKTRAALPAKPLVGKVQGSAEMASAPMDHIKGQRKEYNL